MSGYLPGMGLSSWLSSRVGSLSVRRSVPDQLERLRAADDQVREDAALSFWGRRLDPSERPIVEAALRLAAVNDSSGVVRAHAVAALIDLDTADAVDLALPVLQNDDWAARAIAASQLARARDPRVVDALMPLLHDDEGFVREAAARGLGR